MNSKDFFNVMNIVEKEYSEEREKMLNTYKPRIGKVTTFLAGALIKNEDQTWTKCKGYKLFEKVPLIEICRTKAGRKFAGLAALLYHLDFNPGQVVWQAKGESPEHLLMKWEKGQQFEVFRYPNLTKDEYVLLNIDTGAGFRISTKQLRVYFTRMEVLNE